MDVTDASAAGGPVNEAADAIETCDPEEEAQDGGRSSWQRSRHVIADIVSGVDCPARPAAVWDSLLSAMRYDPAQRTCTIGQTRMAVRWVSPRVGIRGMASWGQATYRINIYVLPQDEHSTRLLVVGLLDLRSQLRRAKLRHSHRLAHRDLRELTHAVASASAVEPSEGAAPRAVEV
jgi:hypothetical protein